MSFEQWDEIYRNKKIIYIIEEFNESELEIFKKLGIIIEDKVYTEYEFECLKLELGKYYREDGMDQEDLEYTESLADKNVADEEYNAIMKKIDEIESKYENAFAKFRVG